MSLFLPSPDISCKGTQVQPHGPRTSSELVSTRRSESTGEGFRNGRTLPPLHPEWCHIIIGAPQDGPGSRARTG